MAEGAESRRFRGFAKSETATAQIFNLSRGIRRGNLLSRSTALAGLKDRGPWRVGGKIPEGHGDLRADLQAGDSLRSGF